MTRMILACLMLCSISRADTPPIVDIFKLHGEGKTGAITVEGGVVTNVLGGASGNVMTFNGTNWISATPPSISVSLPLTYSLGVIGIPEANSTQAGYLSAVDWNIFNNKLSSSAGNYIGNGSFEVNVSG